jgi:hypothetical protein
MNFWQEHDIDTSAKRVLVIPNYTNFGGKDINRDSFLLVFKSFLDNTTIGKTWNWILPYPNFDNYPGIKKHNR